MVRVGGFSLPLYQALLSRVMLLAATPWGPLLCRALRAVTCENPASAEAVAEGDDVGIGPKAATGALMS